MNDVQISPNAEILHLIDDDRYAENCRCPICGAENPGSGFYVNGVLVGCDVCVTEKDLYFCPEFFDGN